jgi:hypothetical protein
MRLFLVSAALLLAATPGAAQREDKIPEATPSGKAVSCIRLRDIRTHKVRSDGVIDFYLGGKRVYRNELPMRCPRLAFEGRFLHKTTLAELCSTDTITVLDGAGLREGASCGLGKFQPVTLATR